MATVTGLTAARMAEIEAASIVDGEVVGDNLILTKHNTTTIDAGNVRGPQGDQGDPGADGVGLPVGGTTGQVLAKVDGTDYNVVWQTINRLANIAYETNNYTLGDGDEEGVVTVYNASAKTVTIPLDTTHDFPVGTSIRVAQTGLGAISIATELGVSLGYPDLYLPTLLGAGALVTLIKVYANSWLLVGNGNLLTTEEGWQTWSPNITGSTTSPNLGTNPVKEGLYIVDSWGRVSGFGTVRWDTAGSPSQGSGYYLMKLPVDGVNVDPEDFSPIGSISAGTNAFSHSTGLLHFDGNTPDFKKAMGAMNGGLFLSSTFPDRAGGTVKVQNVHYFFQYQLDPTP